MSGSEGGGSVPSGETTARCLVASSAAGLGEDLQGDVRLSSGCMPASGGHKDGKGREASAVCRKGP